MAGIIDPGHHLYGQAIVPFTVVSPGIEAGRIEITTSATAVTKNLAGFNRPFRFTQYKDQETKPEHL